MYIIEQKEKFILVSRSNERMIFTKKKLLNTKGKIFVSNKDFIAHIFEDEDVENFNRERCGKYKHFITKNMLKNYKESRFGNGCFEIQDFNILTRKERNKEHEVLVEPENVDELLLSKLLNKKQNPHIINRHGKIYYNHNAGKLIYINLSSIPTNKGKFLWELCKDVKVEFSYFCNEFGEVRDYFNIIEADSKKAKIIKNGIEMDIHVESLTRVNLYKIVSKTVKRVIKPLPYYDLNIKLDTAIKKFFKNPKAERYVTDFVIYTNFNNAIGYIDLRKLFPTLKGKSLKEEIFKDKGYYEIYYNYKDKEGWKKIIFHIYKQNSNIFISHNGQKYLYQKKHKTIKDFLFRTVKSIHKKNMATLVDEVDYLTKTIVNLEENKEEEVLSTKETYFKCPICNSKTKQTIKSVYQFGVDCDVCNDRSSLPEKIMRSVLDVIGLNYDREKIFFENYRYDFYIAEYNTIIEMHGEQHFREVTGYLEGKLTKIKESDRIKKEFAINNKYEFYEIKAYKKNVVQLVKEIEETIPFIENVDIEEVYEKLRLLQSNHYDIIQLHKEGKNNTEIAKILNTSCTRVSLTLKNYGYKSKYISKKRRVVDINTKEVYPSISSASVMFDPNKKKQSEKSVLEVCAGRKKTYKGTKWMYYEDYVEKYGDEGLRKVIVIK